MKPFTKLFYVILTSIVLFSCNSNSIEGRKLYLLTMSLKSSIPIIKEVECDFLSNGKMEVHLTLMSFAGRLKTYKSDTTIYKETQLVDYTFKDGYLEIPDYGLTTRLTKTDNGDFTTNTNETFYKQSIVEILDTEAANERIRQNSPDPLFTKMFLKMLHYQSK